MGCPDILSLVLEVGASDGHVSVRVKKHAATTSLQVGSDHPTGRLVDPSRRDILIAGVARHQSVVLLSGAQSGDVIETEVQRIEGHRPRSLSAIGSRRLRVGLHELAADQPDLIPAFSRQLPLHRNRRESIVDLGGNSGGRHVDELLSSAMPLQHCGGKNCSKDTN